jgi:polysaccharide biosynthesis/export protein
MMPWARIFGAALVGFARIVRPALLWRLLVAALVVGAYPVAAAEADNGYVLGPDDTIQVIVYGQPEAGITMRIKSDGTIVMPLIGIVRASGLTNIGLAKLITDKLTQGGFLKDPVVNVEIGTYVSKTVNVAGKVSVPGVYPLDRPYRALELLLKAGWLRTDGAAYVYLRRPGSAEIRLDAEGLVRGDADKDPLLRPGDTLYVPDADQFFVTGQVNRPGALPVLPGMTMRQALALAGGATATGSSNKVGLIRGGAKEVDADMAMPVQKNDVIIVKERLF